MRTQLFFIWIVLFLLSGCTQSYIAYRYNENIESSLIDNLTQYHKLLNLKKPYHHNLYVKVSNCSGTTSFTFNYFDDLNKEHMLLIKKTNRYLLLESKYRIPVVFDEDRGLKNIKEGESFPHYHGYFIEFDNDGKIIQKGLLH